MHAVVICDEARARTARLRAVAGARPEAVKPSAGFDRVAGAHCCQALLPPRLTINDSLVELREEFESFRREQNEVPSGFPLLAAFGMASRC